MTAPDDLPASIAGALAAMPDPALQASFPPDVSPFLLRWPAT